MRKQAAVRIAGIAGFHPASSLHRADQEAHDCVFKPDGAMSFWYHYLLSSLRARGLQKFNAPDDHPEPDAVEWHEAP